MARTEFNVTLRPRGDQVEAFIGAADGRAGLIECEGQHGGQITWRWTVGLGWHCGVTSFGAAVNAMYADPGFGIDIHGAANSAVA